MFLVLSVLVYQYEIDLKGLSTVMCVLGCSAVIVPLAFYYDNHPQNKIFRLLVQYTMPIFLMHTLFAVPFADFAAQAGNSKCIHVILGLIISFAESIVAAWIMKKSKWLEFFLHLGEFIKNK